MTKELAKKINDATVEQINKASEYLGEQLSFVDSEYQSLGKLIDDRTELFHKLYWSTLGYLDGSCSEDVSLSSDLSRVCDFICSTIHAGIDRYYE